MAAISLAPIPGGGTELVLTHRGAQTSARTDRGLLPLRLLGADESTAVATLFANGVKLKLCGAPSPASVPAYEASRCFRAVSVAGVALIVRHTPFSS